MLIQTKPHGLPMPPTRTALLVAAVVAGLWAGLFFLWGFVAVAIVVAGVAVVCATLGFVKRSRAHRPS